MEKQNVDFSKSILKMEKKAKEPELSSDVFKVDYEERKRGRLPRDLGKSKEKSLIYLSSCFIRILRVY